MPWQPIQQLRWGICVHPWTPGAPEELPLQVGDELYPIERGGKDGTWFRGWLIAQPSLLAGLTSSKDQDVDRRVYIGIFPAACIELRRLADDDTGFEQVQEPERMSREHDRRHDSYGHSHPENDELSLPKTLNSSQDPSDEDLLGIQDQFPSPPGKSSIHSQDGGTPQRAVQAGRRFSKLISRPDRPPAPDPALKVSDESEAASEEPLVDDIASCLREWHTSKLHQLLLNRQYDLADEMSRLVRRLDYARRTLLRKILTASELDALRARAISDLTRGNRIFGDGVVVRSREDRGRVLTADDSCIEATRLQAEMSLGGEELVKRTDTRALYQILLSLQSISPGTSPIARLELGLYSKVEGQPASNLSETFSIDASLQDDSVILNGPQKTVFADVSGADIGAQPGEQSSLFLVIKAITWEKSYARRPSAQVSSPAQSSPTVTANAPSEIPVSTVPRTLNSALRSGSVRGGRQSFMWGRKNRKDSDVSLMKGDPSHHENLMSEQQSPSGLSKLSSVSEGRATDDSKVKRLTGFAVLNVNKFVQNLRDNELKIDISPLAALFEAVSTDGELERSVALDVLGTPAEVQSRPCRSSIVLHLRAFKALNTETVVQKLPTLFDRVVPTSRIGFAGAPSTSRSDIFLTVRFPKLPAQANLLHPHDGHVAIPADIDTANLIVVLEIRDEQGKLQGTAVRPSSSRRAVNAWRSYAIQKGESWNQTISLDVDPQLVPRCHVILSLWEGNSEKPFALAWLPLWVDGAFIQDSDHVLSLYKYDIATSGDDHRRRPYLDLPWKASTRDEAVTGPLACLVLSTQLSSTALSQSSVLLGLTRWQELTDQDLLKLLKQFPFVAERETVMLLKDVFDALFGIVVHHAGKEEFEDLVLNALIRTLAIVHDRRFNLQPMVDEYAQNDFNYPFAFPCLSRSWIRMLDDPASSENSRRLRSTFKVGAHILKFMVKARQQQVRKEVDIGINSHRPTFAKDLRGIFLGLEKLMQNKSSLLLGSKTLAVQYFHSYLPELRGVMNSEEILTVASTFINTLGDVEGRLVLYKLLLIQLISDAELFPADETRREWVQNVANWIAPHWGNIDQPSPQWRDQIRLCCTIVATMYKKYDTATEAFWARKLHQSYKVLKTSPRPENASKTFSPLFPTSYPFPTRTIHSDAHFDEALLEISALLAEKSNIPPSKFPNLPKHELCDGLKSVLEVIKSILDFEAFPPEWTSIHVYHHRSCFRFVESLYQVLLDKFLPPPDDALDFGAEHTELWHSFLSMLLKLVTSKAIEVERFPEQRRRSVWIIGGDIRENGGKLLAKCWQALGWEISTENEVIYGLDRVGGYQVQFISLVGPIVELCLSPHDGLRTVANDIMRSIIISEWILNGNLNAVQTAMIDSLDRLFEQQTLQGTSLQKAFINQLSLAFNEEAPMRDQKLREAVSSLLKTVNDLLDLLIAAYVSDTSNESVQLYETVKLLDYYQALGKLDKYISYVHRVSNMHLKAKNYTEAGIALKLHANVLSWDIETVLPASSDQNFPSQTAFERKEQLFLTMLGYFESAQAWQQALELQSEIAVQYMNNTYDYVKLAQAQRANAFINERISKGDLRDLRYFRVNFRGFGFADNLRDKQFVYEAEGSERTSTFEDRLQGQYPNAKFVGGSDPKNVEGQYVSVFPLSVQRDYSQPIHQRFNATIAVKDYMMSISLRHFSHTTRKVSSSQSIREQTQEKTVYTVAEPFPNILRRAEIVSIEDIVIDPVQIGVDRATRKTRDLVQKTSQAQEGGEANMTLLTDLLMILVSAKSSGGVWPYWELLLDSNKSEAKQANGVGVADENVSSLNVDEVHSITDPMHLALRAALVEHYLYIRSALQTYSRSAHQATRADLEKEAAQTFAPVIEYYNSVTPSTNAAKRVSLPSASPEHVTSSQQNGPKVVPQPNAKKARGVSTIPEIHEVAEEATSGPKPTAAPPLGILGLEGLDTHEPGDTRNLSSAGLSEPASHSSRKGGKFMKRLSKLEIGSR